MATAKAANAKTVSTPRKRTSTATAKVKTVTSKTEVAAKPAAKKAAEPEAKPAAKTPRKRAPKAAAPAPVAAIQTVEAEAAFSDQVARLAYQYWEQRGCPEGSPHEDWYRAEQELAGAQG